MIMTTVEKWECSGLLRGVPENKKEALVRLLEHCATAVLAGNKVKTYGEAVNFAFPLVRRLFDAGKPPSDIPLFVYEVKTALENRSVNSTCFGNNPAVDADAEFVRQFVENWIKGH